MLSFKQYLFEQFVPLDFFSAAARGTADANREIKKKKAFDAANRGFEAADRLSAAARRIGDTTGDDLEGIDWRGRIIPSTNEIKRQGTEDLINKITGAAEAGKESAEKTIEKIKTDQLIPSDYFGGKDPLRRELNYVSPEFKERYDARQERIADVERAGRAPIVTKKPKVTEKPKQKEETKEQRLDRIRKMTPEERKNYIKELNKPQPSSESSIDRSNREMSDYEVAHKRSGTPHLRPRGF
jgi:hypothetical protein